MDVLSLSYQYPTRANIKGGIFVHKLNRQLLENGVGVDVVAPVPYVPGTLASLGDWSVYRKIDREQTIDCVPVEHPRYLALPRVTSRIVEGSLMAASVAPRLLSAAHKADVIHAHTALPDGVVGRLLSAETGTPLVVTTRGSDLRSPLESWAGRTALGEVYRGADAVVFVSESIKHDAASVLPSNTDMTIIHDGVDPEDVIPPTNVASEGPFRVLSVGALKDYKGHQYTIRAIDRLREDNADITLTIIGGSTQYDKELRDLVSERNLEDIVEFRGRIPHEEVMRSMAAADLFVLPSCREGFGIVYVEAMAHGCPAIGCKGEGPEDIILEGETGHLIPKGNVSELTERIREFYADPDRVEDIGATARARALTEFTYDETVEAYKALYRAVQN